MYKHQKIIQLKSLFLIFIIFCNSFAYKPAINSITFNESEPFEIYQSFPFDNEAILQIVKPIDTTTYCLKPGIFLRHISPDGSVKRADVKHQIPDANFCPGANDLYLYDIYRIQDYMLTLYINSTKIDSASYYALVTDKSGTFIRYIIILNFL